MTRMSADTVARLRLAVADPDVVDRYRSHIKTGRPDQCWLWTGAISGKGHGRFQIADQRLPRPDGTTARRTSVVIAHRFAAPGAAPAPSGTPPAPVPRSAKRCSPGYVRCTWNRSHCFRCWTCSTSPPTLPTR